MKLLAVVAVTGLTIIALAPSANAATFAGAGIEVNGKHIGGFGITWDGETRENLVRQLSTRSITFERDYRIPITEGTPNVAELNGSICLVSEIRGTKQVEAEPRALKLVNYGGKWFVQSASLEQALKEAAENTISATAVLNRCRITGTITQTEVDPVRWAAMMANIRIWNPSDEERKFSLYCQVISQDSKSPKDAFVFMGRTYDMVVAPRETIVREFPFIDVMASKPSDLKDTVMIRVGSKPFERYADHIAINPQDPRDAADAPVTIAVKKLRR